MSGIPAWAVRGAKVVCVETAPSHHSRGWNIEARSLYTIRDIHYAFDEWHVAVSEFVNPSGYGPYWPLARFRPAVEPKTEAEDVAMFRDLIRQPEVA